MSLITVAVASATAASRVREIGVSSGTSLSMIRARSSVAWACEIVSPSKRPLPPNPLQALAMKTIKIKTANIRQVTLEALPKSCDLFQYDHSYLTQISEAKHSNPSVDLTYSGCTSL